MQNIEEQTAGWTVRTVLIWIAAEHRMHRTDRDRGRSLCRRFNNK